MELYNNSTNKKKYKHINVTERYKIEGYLEAKKNIKEIAQILGRNRSTIYREINRGTVVLLDSELRKKACYKADAGQMRYKRQAKTKKDH